MRGFLLTAAIALWAFAAPAAAQAPMSACSARAIAEWRPAADERMRVEAYSEGPNCSQAVATIVVRNAVGAVLWADAHAVSRVMTLSGARDIQAMSAALAEWIDPGGSRLRTASQLPAWPATAQAPSAGGFEFYPEPWLDRDAYEALRARNDPIYCYVQGMESLACLHLQDGRLYKVGVQSFPG